MSWKKSLERQWSQPGGAIEHIKKKNPPIIEYKESGPTQEDLDLIHKQPNHPIKRKTKSSSTRAPPTHTGFGYKSETQPLSIPRPHQTSRGSSSTSPKSPLDNWKPSDGIWNPDDCLDFGDDDDLFSGPYSPTGSIRSATGKDPVTGAMFRMNEMTIHESQIDRPLSRKGRSRSTKY